MRNLAFTLCLALAGCVTSPVSNAQVAAISRSASRVLACERTKILIYRLKNDFVAIGCGTMTAYECTDDSCCPYVEPSDLRSFLPSEWPPRDRRAQGSIGRDEIPAAFASQIDGVRACYDRYLTVPPWPRGKVVTKFIIASDGKIKIAAIERTSLGIPEVEKCIVALVEKMTFPAPGSGHIVVVSYPFLLTGPEGPRYCSGRPVTMPAPSRSSVGPEPVR